MWLWISIELLEELSLVLKFSQLLHPWHSGPNENVPIVLHSFSKWVKLDCPESLVAGSYPQFSPLSGISSKHRNICLITTDIQVHVYMWHEKDMWQSVRCSWNVLRHLWGTKRHTCCWRVTCSLLPSDSWFILFSSIFMGPSSLAKFLILR